MSLPSLFILMETAAKRVYHGRLARLVECL